MGIFDYPLPSYAAYIWIGHDGDLRLAIPGEVSEREHILRFPAARCQHDDKAWTSGWAGLLAVLRDREKAKAPIRIGEPGGITGAQLTEMMRNVAVKQVGKREAPKDLALEDIGL